MIYKRFAIPVCLTKRGVDHSNSIYFNRVKNFSEKGIIVRGIEND